MLHLLFLVCTLLFAVETLSLVHFTWPSWDYETAPFRPPKLDITRYDDDNIEPGLLFIGLKHNLVEDMLPGHDAGTIYDQDGNLVWHGPDVETTNIKVQTLFGKPVLSYWAGVRNESLGYGVVHILDQAYREIYTVTLQEDFVTLDGVPSDSHIDLHESKITDRNTMLVTAYNLTQMDINIDPTGVPDPRWVIDSRVYEIDILTNEVLFSWSPLDHQDRLPISITHVPADKWGLTKDRPWDIYHINSVEPADEGYLISIRHAFTAVYVNKDGSIRWLINGETGGDFALCSGCAYSWQHDIRLYDETPESLTLTIFNNACTPEHKENFTTGLILEVDLGNMTVTNKRTLIDRDQMIHAETQGSFQIFDGNTSSNVLMGYGSWATFKEFNARGDPVYTAKFGPDAQIASYRIAKYEWHATPFWNPDAYIVQFSGDPTNDMSLFASWNGATDYDHWAIYGGESVDIFDRSLIAYAQRTGFETEIELVNMTAKYFHVVPMQNGKELSFSTIVEVPQFDGEENDLYEGPGNVISESRENTVPDGQDMGYYDSEDNRYYDGQETGLYTGHEDSYYGSQESGLYSGFGNGY